MDSLQTILFFFLMKWNFFLSATIVFFHSCRKLMVCIVLFITFVWTLSFFSSSSSSSSSYFIISFFSLFFLSHAVLMRKNFPFSVNLFQGNFLLLYPYMDQGLAKSALSYSPTLNNVTQRRVGVRLSSCWLFLVLCWCGRRTFTCLSEAFSMAWTLV